MPKGEHHVLNSIQSDTGQSYQESNHDQQT